MMGIVAQWQGRGNSNASGLRYALFLGDLVENELDKIARAMET